MKPAGIALFVLGAVLAGAGLLWARVGFYASQAPVLFLLLGAGAVLVFVGARMHRDKDPNKAVAWPGAPAVVSPDDDEVITPSIAPAMAVASVTEAEPMGDGPDPGTRSTLDESTKVAPRRVAPTWVLTLPDGSTVPVTRSALLGREPANRAGQAHSLVRLPAPDASVSKTHALIEVDERGLSVTDLESTNGTVVMDADGNETECSPNLAVGVPPGGSIDLGTYPVRVMLGGRR